MPNEPSTGLTITFWDESPKGERDSLWKPGATVMTAPCGSVHERVNVISQERGRSLAVRAA